MLPCCNDNLLVFFGVVELLQMQYHSFIIVSLYLALVPSRTIVLIRSTFSMRYFNLKGDRRKRFLFMPWSHLCSFVELIEIRKYPDTPKIGPYTPKDNPPSMLQTGSTDLLTLDVKKITQMSTVSKSDINLPIHWTNPQTAAPAPAPPPASGASGAGCNTST